MPAASARGEPGGGLDGAARVCNAAARSPSRLQEARGRTEGDMREASRRNRIVAAAAAAVLAVAALTIAFASEGASAAGCGGFENPCSQETAQQFTYGSVQRQ